MYLRTTQRWNRDGTRIRYVHLAHNRRVDGVTRAQVLANLGREDQLDPEGLRRLVASINRYLGDPESEAPAETMSEVGDGLAVTASRPVGTAHLLDGLWHALEIDTALGEILGPRRFSTDVERVCFALVANRAIAPMSKLSAAEWAGQDVAIDGLAGMDEDQAYRAMDLLVTADVQAAVQESVFFAVANLLNLEVDLLLFDTTSTYFERDTDDEPAPRDERGEVPRPESAAEVGPTAGAPTGCASSGEKPASEAVSAPAGQSSNAAADAAGKDDAADTDESSLAAQRVGFRTYGKSKDRRDDLPQIVIGLAVTKEGVPVRCWTWPGNANDQTILPQVRDELRDWRLGRVITVVDRGFSSAENLAYLRRGGGGFIAGMRMRDGNPLASQALARQGRYQQVKENLRVKEVTLESTDVRFVICHNPEQATRDRTQRDEALRRIEAELDRIAKARDRDRAKKTTNATTKAKAEAAHLKAECALRDHPALGRWLRQTPAGRLQINRAKITAEARLDGKYLLATSDPHISAEDTALGYKNLLEAERGFRSLKSSLLLRPIYHRREDRIRAHVLLCWLALLLTRVAERRTGMSWHRIATELGRVHAVTLTGSAGAAVHTTPLNTTQTGIFRACQIPTPPTVTALDPP
jgi:hypothetical protein